MWYYLLNLWLCSAFDFGFCIQRQSQNLKPKNTKPKNERKQGKSTAETSQMIRSMKRASTSIPTAYRYKETLVGII